MMSSGGEEKEPVPLVDYVLNVMKFVDAILSNNSTDDHCREFVNQKGLGKIIKRVFFLSIAWLRTVLRMHLMRIRVEICVRKYVRYRTDSVRIVGAGYSPCVCCLHVLKCWMFSFEGEICSLDVLYGGLGISCNCNCNF